MGLSGILNREVEVEEIHQPSYAYPAAMVA